MSASDAHFFGGLALFIVWIFVSVVVTSVSDDEPAPLIVWVLLNLAALFAFGIWGVTR